MAATASARGATDGHVRRNGTRRGAGDGAPLVVSPVASSLLVAPVRFGLALAVVLGAMARGLSPGRAFAQLALVAVVVAFALMFGQHTRGLDDVLERAEPLPDDAEREPAGATVWAALWPSTVGTTFFAVAALAIDARLATLLAGVLAGMFVGRSLGDPRRAAVLGGHRRPRHRAAALRHGRRDSVLPRP